MSSQSYQKDGQADADHAYQEMLRQQVLQSKKATSQIDHVSRSTRLLEKRKEQLEVQQALDDRKMEAKKAEDAMRKREEDLKRREKELQEELVKYNKFLNDNDAKRVEAERKLIENRKFLDQKDEEIQTLKKFVDQIRKEMEEKKRVLEAHRKYQRFFKSVLDRTDEYKEVKMLIERYKTLSDTRSGLQQQQERSVRDAETEKIALQHYVEERMNDVLALNNEIAGLQKTLETLTEQNIKQETSIDERSGLTAMHTQEYTQVKMAVDNIYRRMLERAGQRYKKVSMIRQIEIIEELLADYKDIVVKVNKAKKAT